MKVHAGASEGLVPASYVESFLSTSPLSARPGSTYSTSFVSLAGSITASRKKKGPAVTLKSGSKRLKYVEAMYDYQARSNVEHSMVEGERLC